MIRVNIGINKRTHWTFVILLLTTSISMICAVYLSEIEITSILIKYTTLPLMLGMTLHAMVLARKLLIDEPQIILTDDYIELSEFNEYSLKGKYSQYKWSDIKEFEIEGSKRNDKYLLTVVTHGEKKSFSINGLERKPNEIMELINQFFLPAKSLASVTLRD